MKILLMVSFLLGSLSYTATSVASTDLNSVIETKDEKRSTEKKRRRKKVEMCNDCGKPETECDCEGHGDNKSDDDHGHH
ncbi:hypothetical protein M902_2595 [Bacteriovorax sp. BAL6_X]|uniref:hypothetical protein n=1 Tax=Bacteriovorax sp. BAL6_X TaxID=1201290 RepID=UPI000386A911|nr:hypothetical protein [Bacteriovorax sp. BAL6_X]EPZ50932.1 hypothetical protein M902_2595 [Bacteriovorax sp. BAL6_X]